MGYPIAGSLNPGSTQPNQTTQIFLKVSSKALVELFTRFFFELMSVHNTYVKGMNQIFGLAFFLEGIFL